MNSTYLEEYKSLESSIKSKLTGAEKEDGELRKASIRRITMELDELEEIIDQLESDAAGKTKSMIQIRQFKLNLTNSRSQLRTLAIKPDKSNNLNASSNNYDIDHEESHTESQRTRLLSSTNQLQSSTSRLTNAERLALENEDIAHSVLGDLRQQREQLESTGELLEEADSTISRAGKTLTKMVRVMQRTRIITISIIIVLVALILLVLWNKFK